MTTRGRRTLTALPQSILEWIIILVVVAVLIMVLSPIRTIDPSPTRRGICRNNLRQIGLALHSYHDDYGSFPPAYGADENGRAMHSWRVLILPYLDQQALYAQYRFDEPWNGPHNSTLAEPAPWIFQCPSDVHERAEPQPWTSYVAVIGPRTCWPGATPLVLGDITDPPDRTLHIVEVRESGIHWMEPRDLNVGQMALNSQPTRPGIPSRFPHAGPLEHPVVGFRADPVAARIPAIVAGGTSRPPVHSAEFIAEPHFDSASKHPPPDIFD